MNPLRKGLFWASSYTTVSARTGPGQESFGGQESPVFSDS